MIKQIVQVKEFQDAFNAPVNVRPTLLPKERAELRQRILEEEVKEIKKGYKDQDLVEIADGVIDCMYILIGTAHEYGFADRLEMLFDEVHRSNMSKLGPDGKPIFREDGKVMKPDTYSPPKLARIMARDFSVYSENETIKEIAEETKLNNERTIKSKIKRELRFFDKIRYFVWEKLSNNLSKKISIDFPISIADPITVKIYDKRFRID